MPHKSSHDVNEAVILCGGLGTRLREVVSDRPKALVELLGRPFLEWQLLSLAKRHRIQHAVLATGHLGEMIAQHFGSSPWCGIELSYSREASPLGTAGGLRLAVSLTESPRILVLNGDTYCHYDSRRLLDVHIRHAASATLWLSPTPEATRFGSVSVSQQGEVTAFSEKQALSRPALTNAGIYLMERSLIITMQPGRVQSLEREVFPSLVGKGLFGVAGRSVLTDIGTPESLEVARTQLSAAFEGLDCQ